MKQDSLAIPIAIVIAAALIAVAIFMTGGKSAAPAGVAGGLNASTTAPAQKPVVKPVTDADHIRGNPNAPILLVEYSDFDCPWCKKHHETMKQLMNEYAPGGKVAWVYRQAPIQGLHPNAPKLAEASECVAALGQNAAFWKFADLVFEMRDTNAQTDLSKLPDFASQAGVNKAAFNDCLNSGKYTNFIKDALKDAAAAGMQGTPHTVVVVGDQMFPIPGALPYENIKPMVDNLISQVDQNMPPSLPAQQ